MRFYIVIVIFNFLILSSCQHRDSSGISDIIIAYQTFQDSLSAADKGKWKVETDSTRTAKKDFYSKLIKDLIGLDTSNLNIDDVINKDLLQLELENEWNDLNFEAHLLPLNAEGGFLTEIIYNLQYEQTNSTEEKKNYVKKLKELPSYLMKVQGLMKTGIAKGKTSPVIITQRCIDLLTPYSLIDPDNNIFINPCLENDSLRKVVKSIIQQDIIPSYKKFTEFLQSEYLPSSKSEPGISALDGGKAYYERKTLYFTTLNMTPDEIFTRGESEVARIRNEMGEVMASSGFKGSLTSFIDFLRTDNQFYAKTPRELLYRATWLAKKIEGKLPQYFTKLPRMPFTVEEVPASIAPNYTGGRYSEGSYETGKAGSYWVNTYKLESRPLYVLPSLTLHESVPGHHLQIMLSKELKNIPKFRENLYISAFGEGWGLYSEYLGKEIGMYETPYEDFGRLTYEMWRACRLVVDVGLHYKGWSRDRAVSYLSSNTALSMHEVNTEIDRYIGWPAQAVSYKIGELKIRELRKEAEVVLGDRFDI
ncbi:MAG: DUF885 domain-containing protein, partial [Saprospiraceae bacterium]|nr:DUF885 domain-containing protein [Saprospiraceae bacterium]